MTALEHRSSSARLGVIAVALTAIGCTVTASAPPPAPPVDPGPPVRHVPLAGTVNGAPFVAQIAIAHNAFADASREVTIWAKGPDATCDKQPDLDTGDFQILMNVEKWSTGFTYPLTVTRDLLYVEVTKTAETRLVTEGRVEVTSAGTEGVGGAPGVMGTLSIRAASAAYGSIEGEVPVLNCTP